MSDGGKIIFYIVFRFLFNLNVFGNEIQGLILTKDANTHFFLVSLFDMMRILCLGFYKLTYFYLLLDNLMVEYTADLQSILITLDKRVILVIAVL